MKTKKNKKCGYFIGVMYGSIDDKVKDVEIMADGLVTGLPYIHKNRDFDGMYDNPVTIALNNLLRVINIADLNTLFSLKISIIKDVDILNREVLKEFSFSTLEPLYKDTLKQDKRFEITKEDVDKIHDEIYPAIVKKGGNEYLIDEFNNVLVKAVKYIKNMKLKDITDPDILLVIHYNYDDYTITGKADFHRHANNIKRYRLESFVKQYIIN